MTQQPNHAEFLGMIAFGVEKDGVSLNKNAKFATQETTIKMLHFYIQNLNRPERGTVSFSRDTLNAPKQENGIRPLTRHSLLTTTSFAMELTRMTLT